MEGTVNMDDNSLFQMCGGRGGYQMPNVHM